MKLITPVIPYSGFTVPNTWVRVFIPEKHCVVFTSKTTRSFSFIVGDDAVQELSVSLITITPYSVAVRFDALSVPNNPLFTLLLKQVLS